MGFPIHLAIRQGNDHNYRLCIICFGLFFYGVFFCFLAGLIWLIDFFEEREKAMCQNEGGLQKT